MDSATIITAQYKYKYLNFATVSFQSALDEFIMHSMQSCDSSEEKKKYIYI